jgi:ABC-type uncharacterized transport system substrate-binding protein
MALGWIQKQDIPETSGDYTTSIWHWLSTEAKSDYIEFVQDGYYSAHWSKLLRSSAATHLTYRLNTKKDIDLMIAMGTWAGQDLANNKHQTSVLVLTATDPVSAGIVKSADDSGIDHVYAHTDPKLYARQLEIFYSLFKFKKIGIAYEDSVTGRSYTALDYIEWASREEGFDIERCFTKSDVEDRRLAEKSVIDCFEKLGPKVDALYITQQGGVNEHSMGKIVEIANRYKIPTFSQAGSYEVEQGILLSMSRAGFSFDGTLYAAVIAKVLNGAKPRDIDQNVPLPPKLALNMKTAKEIGYNPPLVLLGATAEIYP